MPLHPTWTDIAGRLLLTLLAGGLIGLNREEGGHTAGLRTTILVCLAASLSMVQANLLLSMDGKNGGSFAVMDLMRLPLGILSGMGFIGAGAILRKGSLVSGITTAATLWFTTMMGLCFGGGQWQLGLAALASSIIILWLLKPFEKHFDREQEGILSVVSERFFLKEIARQVAAGGGHISCWTETGSQPEGKRQSCRVKWRVPQQGGQPAFVESLSQTPGFTSVEWKLTSKGV